MIPNCKYCGKFCNPKDANVVSEDVYGFMGIDDTIFYHKTCKAMPITDTQLKLIREEAERLYLYTFFTGINGTYANHEGNAIADLQRQAHIQCATLYQEKLNLEREKAKVLAIDFENWLFAIGWKNCPYGWFDPDEKNPKYFSTETMFDTYNKTINNGEEKNKAR